MNQQEPNLPQHPAEESVIEPLDNKVCDLCLERNLIDKSEGFFVQKCVSCDDGYCSHYASVVDPIHCRECLHDVSVKIETVKKTIINENTQTGQFSVRSRKARQITLGGSHWLFAQRKIHEMTDLELTLAIEYHETFLHSLVYERDIRRIEKFHRHQGKQYKIKSQGSVSATTTTKTRKTTIIKPATPDIAAEQAAMFVKMMKASGLSMEDIKLAMMGKKK